MDYFLLQKLPKTKSAFHFLSTICLLIISQPLWSQGISIQSRLPDWIEKIEADIDFQEPEGQGEVYYLLLDRQENIPESQHYFHSTYKITNSEGVQSMSDIDVGYDPAYQKLVFHSLTIIRDGKKVNKLNRNSIRSIQREEDMDRYLYDGTVSAVINLEDVRAGDIIDYEFSRIGYNPIKEGKYTKEVYFNYSLPIHHLSERKIFKQDFPVYFHYPNKKIDPKISSNGKHQNFHWELKDTDPLLTDDYIPSWYKSFDLVNITSLKNWKEMIKWGGENYQISKQEANRIKQKTKTLLEGLDQQAQINAAINFVQNDIRYLGFEDGISAYKPHLPSKVLKQRFGDCKDKSLLLCAILRNIGAEAYPVLVSTNIIPDTQKVLPGFNAFNHCIVNFQLDDQQYFIDPTINNQGGDYYNKYLPPYGKGLILADKYDDLVVMKNTIEDRTEVYEQFMIDSIGGGATFKVTTIYTGPAADSERSYFENTTLARISKNFEDFYASYYDGIETIEEMEIKDDLESNSITIKEAYNIHRFWEPTETDSMTLACSVSPITFDQRVSLKKTNTERNADFYAGQKMKYFHQIKMYLPETWGIEQEEQKIEDDAFSYKSKIKYKNKELTLSYDYERKEPYISPDRFPKYYEQHEQISDDLGYSLTYNTSIKTGDSDGISWWAIAYSFLMILISTLLLKRIYAYDPPSPSTDSESKNIGSWLILVAIGLILTPFRVLYDLIFDPVYFQSSTWSGLYNGGAEYYPLMGVLGFELAFNIFHILFVILLIYLFFKKRTSVPQLVIYYMGGLLAFYVFDIYLASLVTDEAVDNRDYKELFQMSLRCLIWIPYFILSTRVKETFVKHLND